MLTVERWWRSSHMILALCVLLAACEESAPSADGGALDQTSDRSIHTASDAFRDKGVDVVVADVAGDAAAIALQPGHWLEVPDSQLETVLPAVLPPGVTGPRSIMSAWSGAAFDTHHDRLLVWGGGHADYAGNEVYAFDLETLSWSRIWGPTPNDQIPDGPDTWEVYEDGNPSSRHTYNGLAYLPPPQDGLWSQSGALWKAAGGGTAGTWLFSSVDNAWHRLADVPRGGMPRCAWDPITSQVIHRTIYYIHAYDPAKDRWTELFKDGAGSWSSETAAIAPSRRLMYMVGGCHVYRFHLDDHTYEEVATTGDTEIQCATAPGFVWYPAAERFVAWSGQPDGDPALLAEDVYLLDPDTGEWTRRRPASTNTTTPPPATRWGTFGRFRYSEAKDVFVLVNSIEENVFLLRL